MVRKTEKSSLRGWFAAFLFGTTVLGGAALAVHTLHARAATGDAMPQRPALTVSVTPVTLDTHYVIRESFVGRIEPARETTPAAERPGLVTEVLVEEGDRVAKGQVLARLDLRPLEIERARLVAERAGIEADIELADRITDRRAQLVNDGWTSSQTYDEAVYAATALRARRDAVTAAIARTDLDLEKSVITAPFDGEVAARMVDEGTVVAAGTALLEIHETARPQARIGVPSDRAGALAVGDAVTLDYQGRAIQGMVAAITRDLEPGTRTVPVLVDLDTEGQLAMGQVVRLDLSRDVQARGAWVPLGALQEAERGLWSIQTVVTSGGTGIVRREAVEILHVEGERAFVRGTFADGALVVPEGAHRLSNGQTVATAGEG